MIRCTLPILLTIFFIFLLNGCGQDDDQHDIPPALLQLNNIRIGTYQLELNEGSPNAEAPSNKPIVANFSAPLERSTVENSISLTNEADQEVALTFSYLDDDKTFSAMPEESLAPNQTYQLSIASTLRGTEGEEFPGFDVSFSTIPGELEVTAIEIDGADVTGESRITDVVLNPAITIIFSEAVDTETLTTSSIQLFGPGGNVPVDITETTDTTVTFAPQAGLAGLRRYQVQLHSTIEGASEEVFGSYTKRFYTQLDPEPDFPQISDEELLTKVQQQTFKYFYDFAHPASGMARERNTSGDIVTTGGTGFGLMALIVGIERGFITRQQGIEHFQKVISFLETADRFHGVWPHWLNGTTGNVQPFSARDNGGDLVETSFLVQGLLTVRQYLHAADATEAALIDRINTLWHGVEWDWHTKGGENVLYWHWSPEFEWEMNHQIGGYNEALITYFLAAASPTHTIAPEVYHEGWARNGDIQNGRSYYGIELPLGYDYGGPLFFAHYSFLGLDPTGLSDTYGNYWQQNLAHSLINQAHAIENPRNYVGYSEENWGLTASDNHQGYSAHSPTNDLGVVTPTAALSSFPYTPDESMKALKFFYYQLGDRLWGEYGFYDAFNITENWTASSYLAIDQGPIVVMIENYRTGLPWDLFMSAPEVQIGLDKLGFTSER